MAVAARFSLAAVVVLALAGAACAQFGSDVGCESLTQCGKCVNDPSGDCRWCAGAGICLNDTTTYPVPVVGNLAANALCTGSPFGLGGTYISTCSTAANNEVCSAKYGVWDCAGCLADAGCKWCGGGTVSTCMQVGAPDLLCTALFTGTVNQPCPAGDCGAAHGRDSNACCADSTCTWCEHGDPTPGTCLQAAGYGNLTAALTCAAAGLNTNSTLGCVAPTTGVASNPTTTTTTTSGGSTSGSGSPGTPPSTEASGASNLWDSMACRVLSIVFVAVLSSA